MTFPHRSIEHVYETASVKRLEACIPDHWLIRHVTERDYGMDCIVEFVTNTGDMLGHMVAVQLKSVEELTWRSQGESQLSSISGIKTTTVNYWRGIPMPVFLAVHERSSDKLYFSPVNRTLRRKFTDVLLRPLSVVFYCFGPLLLDPFRSPRSRFAR